MSDHQRDLEAAARAFAVTRKRRTTDAPPTFLEFSSQLNFFVTIGYLTTQQAEALFSWFLSSGMTRLPALPEPEGASPPTMYEILSTAIHFGTPQAVLEGGDLAGADIGDFFSGLAHAIVDLVTTVTDGVTDVLEAGTALVQAGTQLVHELHDLVVLAP
jgi:hypothetical protein